MNSRHAVPKFRDQHLSRYKDPDPVRDQGDVMINQTPKIAFNYDVTPIDFFPEKLPLSGIG